jgi:hypothetical protein
VVARGLIRDASTMQGGIEPVAGAIAGEHSTRAIGAMSSWRETDNRQPCGWVAKAIKWSGPVVLTLVATRGICGTFLAPLDQAWAQPAVMDLRG